MALVLVLSAPQPGFCEGQRLEPEIPLRDLLAILENPSAATELMLGVSGKNTHFTVNRVHIIPESAAFHDGFPAFPPTAPATHFRGSGSSGAALGFTLFELN